jgi:hypothetical protein
MNGGMIKGVDGGLVNEHTNLIDDCVFQLSLPFVKQRRLVPVESVAMNQDLRTKEGYDSKSHHSCNREGREC